MLCYSIASTCCTPVFVFLSCANESLFKCSGIMSAQDALLHLILLLFAGKSAEQRAAELQKQIEDQTARIRSMEDQENSVQPAAVAAAHGMHPPFVCCSTLWCVAGPIAEPLLRLYIYICILVATAIVMRFAHVIGLRALSVLTPTTWAYSASDINNVCFTCDLLVDCAWICCSCLKSR